MEHPLTLPPPLASLLDLFAAHGEAAYPVGGCVRDALLGHEPHDWDVAVTTAPAATEALCTAAGLRVIPTGAKHGTVTVLLPASGDFSDRMGPYDPIECTTCRTEGGYSDGRHPDAVTFTGRIADDLSRRDFTVNAMALSRDGNGVPTVLDLFGGQADLAGRVIRCVGDPTTRFAEDALRMLRAVRFSVKLDFAVDPATEAAIRALAPSLSRISRERVSAEFSQILCSPAPERGVRLLTDTGLLPHILPAGAPAPSELGALSDLPPAFPLRLACLLWPLPPEARAQNLASLRLPTAVVKSVTALCAAAELPLDSTPRTARTWRQRLGDAAVPALLVRRARLAPADTAAASQIDALRAAVRASEAAREPVTLAELAVGGRDLIAAGHKPGPALQTVLEGLLTAVMDDPARNTRENLLAMAAQFD